MELIHRSVEAPNPDGSGASLLPAAVGHLGPSGGRLGYTPDSAVRSVSGQQAVVGRVVAVDNDAWSRGTSRLVTSATSRIREALGAWLEEDFDRAASSSPLAVELVAKAVLWRTNPTLLVPLEPQREAALVALATDPNLDSPSLRTVGLKVALGRLTRVLGDLPVPGERQVRLVDCRNGSLHVGTLPNSGDHSAEIVARQVLADALTLCNFLLSHLELDPSEFYGERSDLVNGLLWEARSELEHRVARRLAQARERLDRWREHVEDEGLWDRSAADLETAAAGSLPPEDFGMEMGGIDQECPVCEFKGRLLGRVGVEGDVDVEYEDGGDTYYGYWRLTFYPRQFACNVCKVVLVGPQELSAAHVPAHEREVTEAELGDDFSAAEWAEALYGLRD